MSRRLCLLLLVLAVLPGAAAARTVSLGYDMYAGGLHALAADIVIETALPGYAVRSDVATQGFLDFLARWRSRQESEGELRNGLVRPRLHTRDGEWRFSRRTSRLNYDGDGNVAVQVDPPPEQDDRPPVPVALRRDTVDLLSLLAQTVMKSDPSAACQGGAAVYDGRRRYDVAFAADSAEILKPQEYGSFAGRALRCRVTVTPVAGFKGDIGDESGLGMPKGVAIWLAADAATGLVLPVRFEAEFRIGAVIGHLTRVTAP